MLLLGYPNMGGIGNTHSLSLYKRHDHGFVPQIWLIKCLPNLQLLHPKFHAPILHSFISLSLFTFLVLHFLIFGSVPRHRSSPITDHTSPPNPFSIPHQKCANFITSIFSPPFIFFLLRSAFSSTHKFIHRRSPEHPSKLSSFRRFEGTLLGFWERERER